MTVAEHPGHRPVLAEEALAALALEPGNRAVDATFGRGGHARRLLDRVGDEGEVLALDRDPEAIAQGREAFSGDPRLHLRQLAFSRIREAVAELGWAEGVDAVLADLGVSSPQLEDPARGFSFRRGGPLDMRMDPTTGLSLEQWLEETTAADLEAVLREYGEERHARRVARAIVAARDAGGIGDTADLAEVVRGAVPGPGERGQDKATRTFQALRMAVNREPEELAAFLRGAVTVLRPGGRLAVIAFHSLEDRAVKRFIRGEAAECVCPPDFPVCRCDQRPRLKPVGKPLRPEEDERATNPRARSAICRVAERLAD